MNLILLENKDFIGNERVVIQGRRFNHLISVNKVKKNDRLVCGLLNDKIGTGLITNVRKDSLEIQVHLTDDPPEPLPLILVLALPRPKMLKRIIESVTSLGVK
ncbi:MAG: RsmE family RNA methyltransferase, partial [Desulfobacula sp.]|nr:RsmE family RNA methyltransferase [Desulfobacula sp.]